MSKSLTEAFADRRHFIIYRKADKTPVNPLHAAPSAPDANSNAQDPATHLILPYAMSYQASLGADFGVGIVITEGSQLFAIDLDGCITADGILTQPAHAIVQQYRALGAYVETSMSGRGVHIIGTYTGPAPPHSTKNQEHHLELYTARRYIALTGDPLQAAELGNTRADCTLALWSTAAEYFPPKASGGHAAEWTTEQNPACSIIGTDEERLALALKSRTVRFGTKPHATVKQLWEADTDALAKAYPGNDGDPYDASSADQALFNHFAYWWGENCEAMERVALEHPDCKLRREKWDRSDYLRGTILKAVALPREWKSRRAAPVVDPTPARVAGAAPPPPPGTAPDGEPLPQARHLATDQRNVDRIIAAYGKRLLSVGGILYAWSGRHWEPDTGLAQRFAGNLSRIVAEESARAKAELKALTQGPPGTGDRQIVLEAIIGSLESWGPKCEMAATQNNAVKMLIKAVKLDADKLDADPLLLNLENGTYNIRTGELQPHNPEDFITKIAPVKYDPAATCHQRPRALPRASRKIFG